MSSKDILHYRHALEYSIGIPFIDGNSIIPLQNGRQIFPAMLEAIREARLRIDFVTHVYWTGQIAETFADALAAAAQRGVRVRVLLDAFGCKSIASVVLDRLESANVEVRWFRPLKTFRVWQLDKRTHRKVLVCDEQVAFTGGVGIAAEWEGDARHPGEWRETHVRVQGPAVNGLRAAFIDNWNEAGDWSWDSPIEPALPSPDGMPAQVVRASSTLGWTDMAAVVRSLIAVADQRIRIITAYFAPDPLLVKQMLDAMQRGVELQILIPGQYTDSRMSQLAGHDAIERLLECGAAIWQYEKTMLHTKLMVVDDLIYCIGSPNLNHRSMGKDEECCITALSVDLAAQGNAQFEQDRHGGRQLNYRQWRNRSGWLRLQEHFMRLLIEQL